MRAILRFMFITEDNGYECFFSKVEAFCDLKYEMLKIRDYTKLCHRVGFYRSLFAQREPEKEKCDFQILKRCSSIGSS